MTPPSEPDLALRELRHRMDNAFQMVGGLLAREARTADVAAAHTLRKAGAQVQAFVLLHRALDDAGAAGPDPCAAAFLDALCTHLREACLRPFGIALETSLDGPCPLDERRCRALGLIATELVLNAAKHAFARPARGAVGVCLGRLTAPARVVLGVMDDGCGMAAPISDGRQGFALVERLVADLGGTMTVATGPEGTRIAVTAPLR